MARGGRRNGTPGKAYSNRTDLNAPKPAMAKIPGQPYGAQAEQVRSQQAMPVQSAPLPNPDSIPGLMDPTQRPNEPVTAGIAAGPGPGPEALSTPPGMQAPQPGVDELRALYQAFPFPGIKRLLDYQQMRG